MNRPLIPCVLIALLPLLTGCEPDAEPAPDAAPPTLDAAADASADPPCRAGRIRPCAVEGGCTGSQACIDGVYGPCAADAELCNGLDEDCDGRADEGVAGVGEACTFMRGTCQLPGARACDSEVGRLVCEPRLEEAPDEACNGVDDDCDGATDEQIAPSPCTAGTGTCRVDGQALCQGGRMVCGAEPGAPDAEVCNGFDDDCDGTADEDPGDVGRACGTGLPGICAGGRRICDAGRPVCVPETAAVDEACNGLDDDCDGAIDETFGIGEGCMAGEGGCARAGVRRCVGGAGACDAVPGSPQAEVCNGLDDDCDGAIDEQPPRPEACNGGDDDCDGAIDEGFGLGAPCVVGLGRCESDGVTVCGAGDAVVCNAVPGDPRDELCNVLDDDCDGDADEGLGGGAPCEVGIGACARIGVGLCTDAGPVGCSAEPGEPSPERCNALDDDCDGETDEGFPLGGACTVGRGECRATGVRVCVDGDSGCSAQPGAPQDELCSGRDDDCDGRTDEGFPIGGACERGAGACRARGAFACADDGTLVCDAEPGAPQDEACNGVDDDCDGRIDERLGLGEVCPVGLGLCLRDGVRACGEAGAVICQGEPGPPAEETCDERDEDCDGEVDEGLDLGGACEGGVGACARPGVRVCGDAGGVICATVPGAPAAELCDGADNDCDGAVDEVPCDVYDSCDDVAADGDGPSGTYLIEGLDGAPHSVWCDLRTDGGGWTLVANSVGAPPPDQRALWSPALQEPASSGPQSGVWPDLRRLSLRHDVRFTCGPGADAPPTVDMAFYDVPWYRTLTAGSDRDSCFSEGDGQGALDLPAIRRDLRSGDVRALGQGRAHPDGDWLEGEDACGSIDDFAVDFDGRGLGAPANRTSWGLFDGQARCGAGAVGEETRWQIWVRAPRAAPLGTVGLFGPARLATALEGSGFEAALIEGDDLHDLSGYAVIVLGRWAEDWQALPDGAQQALDGFVRGGGGLITEFDGAALLSSGYDVDFVYRLGAPVPWGWLPMTVGGGGLEGLQGLEVDADAGDDPIARSLPDVIVGQRGPAYFVRPRFDGPPPGRVVTTSASPLDEGFVSTLRFARCGGVVLMNGSSYGDAAEEALIGQLVRNLAGAAASPSPPDIADVCPD